MSWEEAAETSHTKFQLTLAEVSGRVLPPSLSIPKTIEPEIEPGVMALPLLSPGVTAETRMSLKQQLQHENEPDLLWGRSWF